MRSVSESRESHITSISLPGNFIKCKLVVSNHGFHNLRKCWYIGVLHICVLVFPSEGLAGSGLSVDERGERGAKGGI